jgi:hypothetical protein
LGEAWEKLLWRGLGEAGEASIMEGGRDMREEAWEKLGFERLERREKLGRDMGEA